MQTTLYHPKSLAACATLFAMLLSGCITNPIGQTAKFQPDQDPGEYFVQIEGMPDEVPSIQIPDSPVSSSSEQLRAQSPDDEPQFGAQVDSTYSTQDGSVQPATYQYPEIQDNTPGNSLFNPTPSGGGQYLNSPQLGNPSELNPLVAPNYAPSGAASFPQNYADLDVFVTEEQTGRINIGGAYNSDNGIVGQFIIDEKNFDIRRWPRNFREISDGTAWRGGGQQFRLELVPGRNVQRYLVSFTEPYLFDTAWSFNLSGYLFDRAYFDWDEQRIGARMGLGYRLSHDLSLSVGLRAENVDVHDPRVATSTELNNALGDTDLYIFNVNLVSDTRDHPFLATAGTYMSIGYSQGFGEFDYPRFDFDYRRYRLLYERPDGSGRHTLSFGTKVGISGSQTPIFENYFAGGFSTMRGFDFRGASPVEGGVIAGGEFQWLNTLEYMFPLTADDMIKGVLFCDFGTVEESIEINSENFRVSPGFGFRVHMPAAGIGAPLAFDFAFPVARADTDELEAFSFYLGLIR